MNELVPMTEKEYQLMEKQIQQYVQSGLLPKAVNTPAKAMLIAQKGRELGLPPLQALSHLHVIDGKPSMSSELMHAQVRKNVPSAQITFVKSDANGCTIKARRNKEEDWNEFSYTTQDAKAAGVLNKHNWKSHPAAMMRARCISAMCRAMFPDAIAGVSYTPEELGASFDSKGNLETQDDKGDRLQALIMGEEKPRTIPIMCEAATKEQEDEIREELNRPQKPATVEQIQKMVPQTRVVPNPLPKPKVVPKEKPGVTYRKALEHLLEAWESQGEKASDLKQWIFEQTKKNVTELTVGEVNSLAEGLKK